MFLVNKLLNNTMAMPFTLFKRRCHTCLIEISSRFLSKPRYMCSGARTIFLEDEKESKLNKKPNNIMEQGTLAHLSQFFNNKRTHLDSCDIQLVDHEIWKVSSGLAHTFRGLDVEKETNTDKNFENGKSLVIEDVKDFDEIDNMRVHGTLFYKIDRGSKEFEEYNYDFHRKKSSKKKDNDKDTAKNCLKKIEDDGKEIKKELKIFSACNVEKKKKIRTPTYNQLTGPFHEPFCLDIFISKASIRACIIHRVTSSVVAVAHSISKDFKFDLNSKKDLKACVAVGGILAQRALADDIHDIIYTPRKGDKLEGKLHVVLQAVIDNGVNVKVKLKQRRIKNHGTAFVSKNGT